MLNEERICSMTKLYRYENDREQSEYFRINSLYRSDYIGMALLRNFFAVSAGYITVLAVYILYHMEDLMGNWFKMDLAGLGKKFATGYVVTLIVYSVIVYLIYTVRYEKMKKYMKQYDEELKHLEEQYFQEEWEEEA